MSYIVNETGDKRMSINIIEKNIKIGTHLHDFIISEIESSVRHHQINGDIVATVTLAKNTQTYDVHIDLHIHVGDAFFAHFTESGHDAHKSIIMGIEKLKEQLRRPKTHNVDTKSKMCDHEHHDGFRQAN